MKNLSNILLEKLKITKDTKILKMPEIQDAFNYALEIVDSLIESKPEYKVIDQGTRLTTKGLTYGIKFYTSKQNFTNGQLMNSFGNDLLKEIKKKYHTDTDNIEVHAYDDIVTLFIDWDKILDLDNEKD